MNCNAAQLKARPGQPSLSRNRSPETNVPRRNSYGVVHLSCRRRTVTVTAEGGQDQATPVAEGAGLAA